MIFGPKKLNTQEPNPKKTGLKIEVFELATEFGILIALPLLVLTYVGRKLEIKYGSKLYIVGAILLALTISAVTIGKKINDIRKQIK